MCIGRTIDIHKMGTGLDYSLERKGRNRPKQEIGTKRQSLK
jgi:hypothetical protein